MNYWCHDSNGQLKIETLQLHFKAIADIPGTLDHRSVELPTLTVSMSSAILKEIQASTFTEQ